MTKKFNLQISALAVFAAVAVTAMNIYTHSSESTVEGEYTFSDYVTPKDEGPVRGLAGVDQSPSVERLYVNAQELSAQGRFDECLKTVEAIHQEVNEFQNSRELKLFCTQGKARKQYLSQQRSRRTASHRSK